MRRFVSVSALVVVVASGVVVATGSAGAAAVDRAVLVDGFEVGLGDWETTHTGGSSVPDWHRSGDAPRDGSFAAHVVGAGSSAEQVLTTGTLPLGPQPSLTFEQRYAFERSDGTSWDGGVVEYSADGGSTWHDLSTVGTMPYTGVIGGQTTNPLLGRPAFTGSQPTYAPVSVDLTPLANQPVRLRFRVGADDAQSSAGWWIDDVAVQDRGAPFPRVAAPTGLVATPTSSTGVALTFTASAGPAIRPVVGYEATCTGPGGRSATAVTRQTEVEIQGLVTGAPYSCQVHAWTTAGPGDDSTAVSVVPSAVSSRASAAPHRAVVRRLSRPGTEAQWQQRLRVPTTLWSARPGRAARTGAHGDRAAITAARDHLARLAPAYRLSARDVADTRAVGIQDLGAGAVVVSLATRVHGLEIWHERVNLVMNRRLGLVGATGYLMPRTVAQGGFALGPRAAARVAFRDLTGRAPRTVRRTGARAGYVHVTAPAIHGSGRAEQVMYRLPRGLVAAYYVEVTAPGRSGSRTVGYVVAADDGRLLERDDLQSDDNSDFQYRVWADPSQGGLFFDSPHGTAGSPDPSGVPDDYVAPFVPSSLLPGPATGADPWLPAGADETVGNNVDAYTDANAPDGLSPGDFRATTTSPGIFDHSYDLQEDPLATAEQGQAGVTQLFYDTNYLHDWFYGSGFDEAAGNAQQDNYGRGGVGGDPLLAEDQDDAAHARDNANMTTPADGASPRMQMYLWHGPVTANLDVSSLGSLQVSTSSLGPESFDLTAGIAVADDGAGTATDACTPLTNDVNGAVVVVDRGTCTFSIKAHDVQAAGGVGMLLANNAPGLPSIGGSCPTSDGCPIVIPVLGVSQDDGAALKTAVGSGPQTAHLVRVTQPDRDGALDSTIVSHEWAHYLTGRLVPGLGSQQAGAMAEGWSDFVALLMMVRPEDVGQLDGAFAVGSYDAAAFSGSPFYFGIRRSPYSTDLAIDGFTFRHIGDSEQLPNVPLNSAPSPNSEVHNAGEVWATMLWECYAALLGQTTGPDARLTFDQAQRRMSDYLVASLRVTPSDPTFLEARDALLMVAHSRDVADYDLFAAAFAKRGAGAGAVGPDRSSTSLDGVVESYVAQPDPPATAIDLSGGAAGSPGWYTSPPVASVSVTGGAGSPQLRCVLDDPTHAVFGDLPADAREPCDYAAGARMPEGVHTLHAAAHDYLDASSPVASTTVRVDSTPPSTPTLKALPAFTTGTSATLAFRALDATSGVAAYDVEVRQATYRSALPATWSPLPGAQGLTSTSFKAGSLAAGSTSCFRVRAHDVAGNLSAASVQRCVSRVLDDSALQRSPGWTVVKGTSYLSGRALRSTTQGRSLSLSGVRAVRLAVRATTCPRCGSLDVFVGSRKVSTLSLVSKATKPAALLEIPLGRERSGKVRLVTRSARPVVIDAVGASHA